MDALTLGLPRVCKTPRINTRDDWKQNIECTISVVNEILTTLIWCCFCSRVKLKNRLCANLSLTQIFNQCFQVFSLLLPVSSVIFKVICQFCSTNSLTLTFLSFVTVNGIYFQLSLTWPHGLHKRGNTTYKCLNVTTFHFQIQFLTFVIFGLFFHVKQKLMFTICTILKLCQTWNVKVMNSIGA